MTLNKKIKTICFDIDNVICFTKGSNYRKSRPIKKNIRFINHLYDKGFIIKLFTARYMGRNNDKTLKAKKQGYNMTVSQLKSWKVKYHSLFFGKPSFDIFIDDKSLFFKKNWIGYLRTKLNS